MVALSELLLLLKFELKLKDLRNSYETFKASSEEILRNSQVEGRQFVSFKKTCSDDLH